MDHLSFSQWSELLEEILQDFVTCRLLTSYKDALHIIFLEEVMNEWIKDEQEERILQYCIFSVYTEMLAQWSI